MSSGDVEPDHPENELAERPSAPPSGSELLLDSFWPALARVPPLALLAAGAALCHTLLFRLLLPLLVGRGLTLPTVLALAAPYSLNLAACAGLVALSVGTIEVVRARDLTYLGRRVLIGVLAGGLIAALAIATFLPRHFVSAHFVLLSAGALHALVVQLAMTTLRAQTSLAGRTTAAALAGASLFPLCSLLVRHAEPTSRWAVALEGVASLHALGELAYLSMPIAAAFVVVPWDDHAAARRGRLAGAIAVGLMATLFGAAARIPNSLYGHLMYSTLRLEWALERASLGYALPISLAVGAATAASFSRDPRHRQGGAGLWLWLAGGYNPLTPARIFMMALAATLVCRAVLSVGAVPSKKVS